MPYTDWNNDGKIDNADDFIEYDMYGNSNHGYSSGGGISTFGAICAAVISFVISACILGATELTGGLLVIAFVFLVAVIGTVIAILFDKLGL